jgi:uncharacterized protein (TIGR00251 family)
MLELNEIGGGVRMRLRVKAGGRRNALLGIHGGALKLTVIAAPKKGKANKAVLALLAEVLEIPASSMALLSGKSSPDKVVLVPLDRQVLLEKLSGLA